MVAYHLEVSASRLLSLDWRDHSNKEVLLLANQKKKKVNSIFFMMDR